MSIINFLSAIYHSSCELIKAHDNEVTYNRDGLPMLAEWQGADPYAHYNCKIEDVQTFPYGTLVVLKGKNEIENIKLSKKITSVSTKINSDIVINSTDLCEATMYVKYNGESVIVTTDNFSYPLIVNGQETESAQIFDHDEISFLGADFVFIKLGGIQ